MGVGALLAALVVSVAPAQAGTFEVLNLNDSGPGSLRHAIDGANTTPGADTITFGAGAVGTITLITGQLSVSDDLTIDGPGATNLAISGAGATRVSEVVATTLQLKGVTVANGSVEYPAAGGGIFSTGTLAVTNTAFVRERVHRERWSDIQLRRRSRSRQRPSPECSGGRRRSDPQLLRHGRGFRQHLRSELGRG